MPSREEKRRRKALHEDFVNEPVAGRQAERTISLPDLRDLFDCLDLHVGQFGCDHTLKCTRQFLSARGLDENKVVPWLAEGGGYCDCEVLANVGETWDIPPLEEIHRSLLEVDHYLHESLIAVLQRLKEPSSVPFLLQAVGLKPQLAYLDYDDYGSYYKKCLWALQAIGTPEALRAIEEFAQSPDPVLKAQARYRLTKIRGKDGNV